MSFNTYARFIMTFCLFIFIAISAVAQQDESMLITGILDYIITADKGSANGIKVDAVYLIQKQVGDSAVSVGMAKVILIYPDKCALEIIEHSQNVSPANGDLLININVPRQEEIAAPEVDMETGKKYNPDGRLFQLGLGFVYGNTSVQSTNVSQALFSLSLPVSKYLTTLAAYGFVNSKNNRKVHTGLFGFNFYSNSIATLNELKNPDGRNRSLIVSLLMGVNSTEFATPKMNSSASLAYIAGNYITIELMYTYSQIFYSISRMYGLGFRLHSKVHNAQTKMINPDGRVGMFTIIPTVAGVSTERDEGYEIGLGLSIPFSTAGTLLGEFSSMNLKYNSAKSYLVGVNLYFK